MNCQGTRISGYGSNNGKAPVKNKTYANRSAPSQGQQSNNAYGSPKVTMKFSGRPK